MSTPTIIQAHIADLVFDDHNPGIAVSDTANHRSGSRQKNASESRRFSGAVKLASKETRADHKSKNVAVRSWHKRVADAGAASLDDFGGRSDALGG
jgi:hypothetical protein